MSDPPIPASELAGLLSDSERDRAARFHHEIDARRHIIGRGLARIVLGRALGIPPGEVGIRISSEGKPFLEKGPSFSIAHSGPVVLVGFAAAGRLGVDVEAVRELTDLTNLARTTFAPDEVEALMRYPPPERLGPFYRIWTRKEAMLKALGWGLAGLPRTSVTCEPERSNALLRIDEPEDRRKWCVRSVPASPGLEAAVAWDRPTFSIRDLTL